MKNKTIYRRICNSRCGFGAHIEEHRVTPSDTPSNNEEHSQRIDQPMKRINGTLTPVSWESAIDEIGDQLKAIRKAQGPSGIGVYIGEASQRSARTLIRSLAFGVGSGTPHIFSEANLSFAPQIWATEKVLGHAASLMSDLSRAHYIVLLSGAQREVGWGPLSPGGGHENWIQHSRKTKKTKVVVADPRRTELADTMDKHLPIRPGSESYLMLGMLTAIVQSGWTDDQFIRDYTTNFDKLKTLVADWRVEDFASMCGIDAAELSGVALSFSRSAMSIIHPARQSFQNEAGALGAWAWLAIHAVTANILRPGGLFENKGIIDLFPVLNQLKSDKAPKTDHTGYSLLLMQAPAAALPKEISNGPVRALISVSGNPLGRLPNPTNTAQSLGELDLLVWIGQHPDETAQLADWVLPSEYPWEQSAMTMTLESGHSGSELSWSSPPQTRTHTAQPAEKILSDLYAALKPGLRGSVWGRHLALFAQYVARADLEQWEEKILAEQIDDSSERWKIVVDESADWASPSTSSTPSTPDYYLHLGDGDRSLWRPSTTGEKVQLLADDLVSLCRNLSLTEPSSLVLRTGQWRNRPFGPAFHPSHDEKPLVYLHPDLGFSEGSDVQIQSAYGVCVASVVHDDRLRPDVIDLPFYPGSPSLHLLTGHDADPIVGSIVMDGLEASLSPA